MRGERRRRGEGQRFPPSAETSLPSRGRCCSSVRPDRRHVVLTRPAAVAAAAALVGSVHLIGPARGLSPIGGRRRRGGSLVIGRWRGGREPGTLLVALAPA